MDHGIGGVGQRPHPRPAVQVALHSQLGAVVGRGHREVSGLWHDPGHRAGLRTKADPGVRREGLRCHRGRARAAARGDRHRPSAGDADHRRLGRAEGRPRDHGVPSQPRRRHGAGGADIQDLRGRRRGGHDGEPVPPGSGHPRHRVQDRRRDRDEARHRQDGQGSDAPRRPAGFTPGGAPRLPKRRPKGPGANLRDDRGGGVSLSPEREAGLAGIAETLATGASAHGGKPVV